MAVSVSEPGAGSSLKLAVIAGIKLNVQFTFYSLKVIRIIYSYGSTSKLFCNSSVSCMQSFVERAFYQNMPVFSSILNYNKISCNM